MKRTDGAAEILRYTRYYEQDGKLRAYANRAMLLTTLFAIVATASLGFAVFVRLQPPTVIRVDSSGNATVVGHAARIDPGPTASLVLETQVSADAGEAAPTPLEGKAVVRRFLEHYLAYTPDSVDRSFAESLNMMTSNLRTFTLNKMRDQTRSGRSRRITSSPTFAFVPSIKQKTRRGPTSYSESKKCIGLETLPKSLTESWAVMMSV